MRLRSAHAKARATIVAGLATALLCSSALAPASAYAATADELQSRVDAATQAYGDATAKVSELQAKIDESQAKIDEVNAELPEQRERAEQSLSSLYKMQQGTPGLVSLLLSSDSFADFFTTYQYLNAVQRSNTDALAELNRMEGELSAAQQTLQAAKDEASAQQQQAQTSMTEAQTALDELNAQLVGLFSHSLAVLGGKGAGIIRLGELVGRDEVLVELLLEGGEFIGDVGLGLGLQGLAGDLVGVGDVTPRPSNVK